MHLNGGIGKTKVEETLDIGFTNENTLVPQSSLSFYLDHLSLKTSNIAAIVIVSHTTICFVPRDGKLFVCDSHFHFAVFAPFLFIAFARKMIPFLRFSLRLRFFL